jgi:hypothetical protein
VKSRHRRRPPKAIERVKVVEHDGHSHTLIIPDELLAWGSDPEVTRRWADKQLVATIQSLIDQADLQEAPLEPDATEKLLACIESLVGSAVAAGRVDLLVGIDLATAEWLDLRFIARRADGRPFVIARDGDYTPREMRLILGVDDPKAAAALAEQAKALLVEAGFEETIDGPVRIDDVTADQDRTCGTCGDPLGSVMLCLEGEMRWCVRCYSVMTNPLPEHIRKIAAGVSKAKSK